MRLPSTILLLGFALTATADAFYESTTVLVDALPISVQRQHVIVLKTEKMDLVAGELLDVRFQIAATTEYPRPVMIGREVRYSTAPEEHPGKVLIPAVASNITRDEHHTVVQGSRLVEVSESARDVFVYLVLWANRYEENDAALVMHEHSAFLQVHKRSH